MKKIFFLAFTYSLLLQLPAQQVVNPILSGFYPDPSICRAGDDYYIVTSSFSYYPGLPIFHSRDLLNWKQIGYAMDRPSQLNLDSSGVSRGLFAPAISYHDGTFYIVCTEVTRLGNFVITAKDPRGPWSEPVKLPEVNGIDPSLFFDDDGKSYIVYNSIPPGNVSLHEGHRTIRLYEFDKEKLKVTGQEALLVNGGTDMAKKPVWIEGPHLLKKNGWYYLLCAEGGTGYNHSEVVFRSRSPLGPFISYENNPILTQRHLDPKRKDPVTTTGHADVVETPDGKWWGVFLGCRPYEGDFYNTGRETFIAPMKWENEWPAFDLGGDEVKYSYPINAVKDKSIEPFNGNYHFRDEFSDTVLNFRYRFLRTVRENWYNLSRAKGSLQVTLRPETCSGLANPSMVAFGQPHLRGHAATRLQFKPASGNERAGLLLFQNEKRYYNLCVTNIDGEESVALYKANKLVKSQPLPSPGQPVYLKIAAQQDKYAFYFGQRENEWKLLKGDVDAKWLSTKTAGGFVGCIYAMYATSNGKPSTNIASYDWFEIKNEDSIYK